MPGFLDWLTGKERARQEADVERARQAAREAQDRGLDERTRELASQPKPIERREDEARPGERLMPEQAERMRTLLDNPPQPEPQAEPPAREASRMAYTRTTQPAPSMGGAGTRWVNTRVQQPKDFADQVLEAGKAELAREEAALTPEQRLERDRQQAFDRERDRTKKPTDTSGQ